MMVKRCQWRGMDDPVYQSYHDHEWGKLNLDEHYLYEMLVLESFQSGLSWLTVIKKRANFRKAFANFDVEKVAAFNEQDRQRLLKDTGIIRNRLKIDAAINNARVMVKMHQQGQTLGALLKELVPKVIVNHPQMMAEVPAKTAVSSKVAKKLKQLGFRFVGPTTTYSFLQGVGLVNDHLESCDFKYSSSFNQE